MEAGYNGYLHALRAAATPALRSDQEPPASLLEAFHNPQPSKAAMTIRTGTERIVETKMQSRAKVTPAL